MKLIKWALSILLFIFFGVTGAIVGMSMGDPVAVASMLFMFALCMTVLLTVGLGWLGWCTWRLVRQLFGGSALSRLISLGVMSLLFPETVRWLIFEPALAAVNALLNVPEFFTQSGKVLQIKEIAPIIGLLLTKMAGVIPKYIDGVRKAGLYKFPIALTVWAIFGWLLSYQWNKDSTEKLVRELAARITRLAGTGWERITRLASTGWDSIIRVPKYIWQNSMFVVVLLFGLFLSIAAITAIPLLIAPTTTEEQVKLDTAKDRLTEITDVDALVRGVPTISPAPLVADLVRKMTSESQPGESVSRRTQSSASREAQSNQPAEGDLEGASASREAQPSQSVVDQEFVDIISDAAERMINERKGLELAYSRAVATAKQDLDQQRSQAIALSDLANASLRTQREKTRYIAAIEGFTSQYVAEMQQQLQLCAGTLSDYDSRLEWVGSSIRNFLRTERYLQAHFDIQPSRLKEGPELQTMINRWDDYRFSSSSCHLSQGTRLPDTPKPGGELGPFSYFRWLINLDSMALVLISGMLGFGLLGAGISSFVRTTASRRLKGGPWVPDLPAVLIRGLSATLVVYLSVQGGLTIFSVGGDAPKPYSLLLTCFLAAVFSEDVWERVQRRIRDVDRAAQPVAPASVVPTTPSASS